MGALAFSAAQVWGRNRRTAASWRGIGRSGVATAAQEGNARQRAGGLIGRGRRGDVLFAVGGEIMVQENAARVMIFGVIRDVGPGSSHPTRVHEAVRGSLICRNICFENKGKLGIMDRGRAVR